MQCSAVLYAHECYVGLQRLSGEEMLTVYEELYENLTPQMVKGYLQRIGLKELAELNSYKTDLGTLNKLIAAHQTSIPFETLEMAGTGADTSLATADLYKKIVLRNRGGYCFELNGLFEKLLAAMGFEVRSALARAVMQRTYLPPCLHRCSFVCIDTAWYLVDVGFGGPTPDCAILRQPGIHHDHSGRTFSLEQDAQGWWQLSRITLEGAQKLLLVDPSFCGEIDFLSPNYYCSHAPDSHFVQNRIVNRRLKDTNGFVQIHNNVFRRTEADVVVEECTITSRKQYAALLDRHFGIAAK
jgi:N-hydroxyarylamine O-acetyltransferase